MGDCGVSVPTVKSYYQILGDTLSYWRTASQLEVDFVLGDHAVAVEVKSTENAQSHHFRGLLAFADEFKARRRILV